MCSRRDPFHGFALNDTVRMSIIWYEGFHNFQSNRLIIIRKIINIFSQKSTREWSLLIDSTERKSDSVNCQILLLPWVTHEMLNELVYRVLLLEFWHFSWSVETKQPCCYDQISWWSEETCWMKRCFWTKSSISIWKYCTFDSTRLHIINLKYPFWTKHRTNSSQYSSMGSSESSSSIYLTCRYKWLSSWYNALWMRFILFHVVVDSAITERIKKQHFVKRIIMT